MLWLRLGNLMAVKPQTVTQILQAAVAGDPQSAEYLLPLVYHELRRLAVAKMANPFSLPHWRQKADLYSN
jgi:hypothetical protein